MLVKALNAGQMPGSKLQYEDLEGFLASIHMTYCHLNDSTDQLKREKYEELLGLLNKLAKRYKLQSPEEAVQYVRSEHPHWKPRQMKYARIKNVPLSLYQPFGLNPHHLDNENIFLHLNQILHMECMKF